MWKRESITCDIHAPIPSLIQPLPKTASQRPTIYFYIEHIYWHYCHCPVDCVIHLNNFLIFKIGLGEFFRVEDNPEEGPWQL